MDPLSGDVSPRVRPGLYPRRVTSSTSTRTVSAIVIGSGFGGLAAAVELRNHGVEEITILEKADRVGGVWRDNTYPGAACDVPSSLYSFSFAPNPDWRRRYAQQPDILAYIERVTRGLGLDELVHTGVEVTEAEYDEDSRRWLVRTAGGTTYAADVLVSAVGQLSRPALPHLPGLDSFEGPAFHSAEWDHDVDLTGRSVAVVGTGASAIQFVPELQKVAGRVTVFQRSAPYVVPKPDRAYTALHHVLFRRLPPTQGFGRELTRTLSESFNSSFTEESWITKALRATFRASLRLQVKDPVLRRKLTPDYPIGCKRVLFSNDWFRALTRPNVSVVTEPIAEVTPSGLRTADGTEHPADVIVYGTGFKATEFLEPIRVVGRGGRELHRDWADGARAYLGMTVPGFPNLFLVYGPNTNLGGSSILSMIECQTGYIGQGIDLLKAGVLDEVEVREEVAAAFDEEIQGRLSDSVWSSCSSWYRTDGGRITTNWPGRVQEYRERTALLDRGDYVAQETGTPLTAV